MIYSGNAPSANSSIPTSSGHDEHIFQTFLNDIRSISEMMHDVQYLEIWRLCGFRLVPKEHFH